LLTTLPDTSKDVISDMVPSHNLQNSSI
jgi:hypothetical protein